MTKEELPAPATESPSNDPQKKLALEIALPNQPELVVCEVCGHKNTKDAGLCVMCSNYLFH